MNKLDSDHGDSSDEWVGHLVEGFVSDSVTLKLVGWVIVSENEWFGESLGNEWVSKSLDELAIETLVECVGD